MGVAVGGCNLDIHKRNRERLAFEIRGENTGEESDGHVDATIDVQFEHTAGRSVVKGRLVDDRWHDVADIWSTKPSVVAAIYLDNSSPSENRTTEDVVSGCVTRYGSVLCSDSQGASDIRPESWILTSDVSSIASVTTSLLPST